LAASSEELEKAVPLQGLLGYLNFSEGRPDPRIQKHIDDAYRFLTEHGDEKPWQALAKILPVRLKELHKSGASAFRDIAQADGVLRLVFEHLLPAYLRHHADLLAHLSDRDLFQPFFLARVFESVLAQGGPWNETERIVTGALTKLNDFVGHRPIAVLETRPRGEPYDHERVRPIPLYVRGAGVAFGRYHDLIEQALQLLQDAAARGVAGSLADAYFDFELLDELAVDPRAYNQLHPVHRRINYIFGEWDPHQIDNQGRYRRFVVRQIVLDALLDRIAHPGDLDPAEALFDAAAVLAGTMLMASATSGSGPDTHDSTVTMTTLAAKIAQCRDAFYKNLHQALTGPRAERLREEQQQTRQPFGAVRQHLNQFLARDRAFQLQQRHIALLFATMGYPEASREEAGRIPVVAFRFLGAIQARLRTGQLLVERGEPAAAAALLPEVEDLVDRGIACGALPDPWNILGFQGLFPLFTSREDSLHDSDIDDLIYIVEQLFDLYIRVISEAAATGNAGLARQLLQAMKRRTSWWDRFASYEVGDVERLHGGEAAAAAEHVSKALARWRERGAATADLAFWRQHLEGFRSPKAFALVVEALLRKADYQAGLALLMNWLGHAEEVPLEDREYAFATLALQWMADVTAAASDDRWPLIKKFFDYMEANAEDFWQAPTLQGGPRDDDEDEDDDEEERGSGGGLFDAAYEGVTFRDSAADGEEGAVAEGGEEQPPFDLEDDAERLAARLNFLALVPQLWRQAARFDPGPRHREERRATLAQWLQNADENQVRLLDLLDALHQHTVPEPSGSHDSLVEFDRRRTIKEQLLHQTIVACLETAQAMLTLQGAADAPESDEDSGEPDWWPVIIDLEQALFDGDVTAVRELLDEFLATFQEEPLLYVALADGGDPRQMLRVRLAQEILRTLVRNLPRLGMLSETLRVLKTAREMEQRNRPDRRGVSEFNDLFQAAFTAVLDSVLDSAAEWEPASQGDEQLAALLETLAAPFQALWVEYSRSLQLSSLETLRNEDEWQPLRRFIQHYGRGLFHAKFMTLGNLRGILLQGVGPYLDYLAENADPLHPLKLLDDLDRAVPRDQAIRQIDLVLRALVENYEDYKDYNTTTTQSDYGENLHLLLDFLRLKISYDRHAWQLRPLLAVHETLARRNRPGAALMWAQALTRLTKNLADQHEQQLAELERRHFMRLRSIADRLHERFVKPLALDRLGALVEPAMRAAQAGGDTEALRRFRDELRRYAETPTGTGLDVPPWIERLEIEVDGVAESMTALGDAGDDGILTPLRRISLAELQAQLRSWQTPLLER
jgi:hypothetical protein